MGEEIGETKKTKEVVLNSHKAGIPAETIAVIANITVEQVLKIIDDENLKS